MRDVRAEARAVLAVLDAEAAPWLGGADAEVYRAWRSNRTTDARGYYNDFDIDDGTSSYWASARPI